MTSGLEAAYDHEQERIYRRKEWEKSLPEWASALARKLGTTSDLDKIEARIDSLLKGEKLVGDAAWRAKICSALHITTWASDDEIETRLIAIGVVTGQAEVLAKKQVDISR